MTERTSSRLEWPYVITAFAIHLIFQIHAIFYNGFWSQDFSKHKYFIAIASEIPWKFFMHYLPGQTNPPLYHFLAGLIRRFAGTAHYLTDIGFMNVFFGFAGFCFAYGIIRRMIASPLLRMAAITLLLFLPFAMIHAEVVAADALSTPLFLFLLWFIFRFDPRAPIGKFLLSAIVVALGVIAGIFTKFMFGSFILATGVWALALWWTRQINGRRLALLLIVITVIPAVQGYRESVMYRSAGGYTYSAMIPPTLSEASMNPRSIVWVREADVDVLSAPSYNWRVNRQYDLLLNNKHSFPAIVHLAMFTDILNTYQYDPYDYYFGQRGKLNHQRMQIAVRSGVLFSVLMVISVIVWFFWSSISVIRRRTGEFLMFDVMLFCLAWFMNIVLPLPFIPGAYYEGYWTPRLMAPALIGFFIAAFVLLDRIHWQSPRIHAAVLGVVLAQSVVHASFLWPHPSNQRLYENDSGIWLDAYSKGAVFRVYNWQDSFNPNYDGVYWFGPTMGIAVDRAENGTAIETWNLTFKVKKGPSTLAPRGVMQVSSPNAPPRQFEFENESDIQMDIPLTQGRNDIRLDFISPVPVELPQDPAIEMAQISDIKLTSKDGREAPRILP